MQEVAVSQGLKTRSVNRRAPLNLLGGYRFPKSIEIEAALAVEGCLLVGEPGVELPTVESPPLITSDPFDIPLFLNRRCKRPVAEDFSPHSPDDALISRNAHRDSDIGDQHLILDRARR